MAPRYKLENDAFCGITKGGQKECYWDCNFWPDPYFGTLISNPECLLDCYTEVGKIIIYEKVAGERKNQSSTLPPTSYMLTLGACPGLISFKYVGVTMFNVQYVGVGARSEVIFKKSSNLYGHLNLGVCYP